MSLHHNSTHMQLLAFKKSRSSCKKFVKLQHLNTVYTLATIREKLTLNNPFYLFIGLGRPKKIIF
jgi:hypothetical protein